MITLDIPGNHGNKTRPTEYFQWFLLVPFSRVVSLSNMATSTVSTCTNNVYLLLPLTKGHLSNVATISKQIWWHFYRKTTVYGCTDEHNSTYQCAYFICGIVHVVNNSHPDCCVTVQ